MAIDVIKLNPTSCISHLGELRLEALDALLLLPPHLAAVVHLLGPLVTSVGTGRRMLSTTDKPPLYQYIWYVDTYRMHPPKPGVVVLSPWQRSRRVPGR